MSPKNFSLQTEDIVEYLKDTVFRGSKMHADYKKAIAEFEKQKNNLEKNPLNKWEDSANRLAGLKLTQMTRQTFVEERYSWLVYFQNRSQRLLESMYTWTGSQTLNGGIVIVGSANSEGANMYGWRADVAAGNLSVVFSR